MRATAIVTAVVLNVITATAQPANPDREAVLKVIRAFTDTMAAQDVEGARQILQPQGRFHAISMRDGKPELRAFSNEEYFAELKGWKQKMIERI